MANCPHCGAELEDLNPKFCGDCGKPIPGTDASSLEDVGVQGGDAIGEIVHASSSGSEVSAQPSGLPRPYNRNAEDEAQARHADGLSITIDINRNRFYMEGRSGVLELRIFNGSVSDSTIAFTVASTLCEWIGSAGRDSVHIPPGKQKTKRMQMRPLSAGEVLLGLNVECKVGAAVHRFTAEPMIRVLETTTTPQNLSITIDQSLKAGGDVYAASMRSQADDLLKKGIIKSNNDLLERAFDDDWQPVDLHDANVAELPRVRIVSGLPRRAPTRDKASLHLHDDWVAGNILLLSQSLVRMGRNRDGNEVVLRLLPRSPQNDEKTASISREHVGIAIQDDGLFLIDRSGSHETQLDGRPVNQRAPIPLNRPSVVQVGGVLQLRLVPFFESTDIHNSSCHRYAECGRPDGTWQIAERLGIRSLLIERVNNLANDECYIIVYRWANVGCAAGHEVMIPGAGLEDVHARIVRLGSQFWLHAMADGVVVDGVSVLNGHICPLAAGMPVLLGGISGELAEFKQVGL